MAEPPFLRRSLNVAEIGGHVLLEAVALPAGAGRSVRFFFRSDTPMAALGPAPGLAIEDMRSIGKGPMVHARADTAQGPLPVPLKGGGGGVVTPTLPETDLFAGLNVAFAQRNSESAAIVLDWLSYHAAHHGMQAALILDRAAPGGDDSFAAALCAGLPAIEGVHRVVLLNAATPLGLRDAPPEAHPICAPDAPGKDRMTPPPPDPWTAPLGEMLIYEIARTRFLSAARAVVNIDLSDLLAPDPAGSVFDRAVASAAGCITIALRRTYPWRVRKQTSLHFGDHICVQFDTTRARRRWCVAPARAGEDVIWRIARIVGADPGTADAARAYRCMALRHPGQAVSTIVPKTSLVEDAALVDLAQQVFRHRPVRMPKRKLAAAGRGTDRTAIVTTMKNEGPFILEWIAYHRAIGVADFLIYTNDCTDGTDTMLQLLQDKGLIQHRDNPFRQMGLRPQHAALQAAEAEPLVRHADWVICMDVDEYINIHAGEGRLADLYRAVGGANMIALTWRLFGNSDIHEYRDRPVIAQFTRCAPQFARKPHQAWGFKTLFRQLGIFKKLGVHRPKGLRPQLWDRIAWVNGSGQPLPRQMYRNAWRSTTETYGYDLVTLNHYAVRSAESFLVKRDRGRVNHVDRDQGLAYWFRMNNNAQEDRSIGRMLPAMQAELDRLMADPEIAAAHAHAVARHRAKIAELRATDSHARFYADLTSPRMERLSRLHAHFGANVFLAGPDVIPDEIAARDPDETFFFSVDRRETSH